MKNELNYPLITVITVVYNGEKTIERTIQSIQNQTYKNIEYIIIDGNSTDNTLNIAKKYSCITKLICEPDKGIYDAMNKGIANASGDYIALLNADDWYENNTCEIVAEHIRASNKDVYYGMLKIFLPNNELYRVLGYTIASLDEFMIAHPTCFISKKIYDQFQYDLKYKSAADYDFILKIRNNAKFEFIDKILANFTLGGFSSNYFARIESLKIRRHYKCISLFGFIKSSFICYIRHLLSKK